MSSIPDGYNRTENHEWLNAGYEELIPFAAKLKVPNIICMSGNRRGMDDETAIKNCAIGLKKIMPLAEKFKINIIMELLNSKNHVDYQCDHSAWGVELCKAVGSSRFSLLYDIYHMQRMEGDIIDTINTNHEYFGHYHTAGSPGRKDLDDAQELYYPAIMKAIKATGFTGFVAHEFSPKKGIASVRNAIMLCDV
ncbi:MAG: TIM barrel protein [Thermoguttaceae bacterium]|nr:TIM barrel protein [Thermoguttaceae bacterium]